MAGKSKYWRRLQRHPGVPIASALTIMMVLAGAGGGVSGAVGGAISSLLWWAIVLWTARTQPIPEDYYA